MLGAETNSDRRLLSLELEALRDRLRALTPEVTESAVFADIIHELQDSADPAYVRLSDYRTSALDCCGTGGSGKPHFNTSTSAAFVLAAAGVRVVKFGNRAASSLSGSFDFLGSIGFAGTLPADAAVRMLEELGLVFLYAPDVYPQLVRLVQVRRDLGHPTILNYVGPLLNPCRPRYRFMGVSHPRMQQMVASFLSQHQPDSRAVILRSPCGFDELCPRCGGAAYYVSGVAGGRVSTDSNSPSNDRKSNFPVGETLPGNSSYRCAAVPTSESFTPQLNAERFFQILDGNDTQSSSYQSLLVNSAQALESYGAVDSLLEGVARVENLLAGGDVKRYFLRAREAYEKYTR